MRPFNSKSHQYDSSKNFQELLSPRLFQRRQQNGGTIVQRVLQQQQFQQMFQQYQLQQQQQRESPPPSTVFGNSYDGTLCQSDRLTSDSSQTLLHIGPNGDDSKDHSADVASVDCPTTDDVRNSDSMHSQQHNHHRAHLQPMPPQQHQQQHSSAVSRASSVRSAPLRPSRYESSSLPRMGVNGGVGGSTTNISSSGGNGHGTNCCHGAGRGVVAPGSALLPSVVLMPMPSVVCVDGGAVATRRDSIRNGYVGTGANVAAAKTAAPPPVSSSSLLSSSSNMNHQQQPQQQQQQMVVAATNGDLFPANMQMRVEWNEQQRRRLYRIALNFFNKTPDLGVQLLISWGFVRNSPRELALLFMERRGISKQMIGEYLGTLRSQFHTAVLNCFIEQISMYDMEIDIALRQLLKHIRLPLEAQKIDHIIQAFAQHYVACNRNRLCALDTPDSMYILAFAVIMLNTDLHTPSLKDSRRMKLDEFVQNLYRLEEARHMDRNILAGIYERVKQLEFQAGADHVTQVLKVDQSIPAKEKPKLVEPHRRLICYCRLHQLIDPNKRQSATAHQREIFLFNDLMLVCKLVSVARRKSSGLGQYQLRHATPLIGLQVKEFQNNTYPNGLIITCADGQVLMFNAKNGDDRFRFIADIRESVAESTEMEQWRRWSWSWTNSSNRSTPLSADGSSNE
ncbi:hypothetical protein niasHT_016079 [Heterodera trifolii]|uniref:SEC7 domain-containing protein n=1 Tax=Heterodera trifolii TaxID=157864 RepID=A0ABD2L5C5_9BILA